MTRNGGLLRAIAQGVNGVGGRVLMQSSSSSDGIALQHYAEQLQDIASKIDRFKHELVNAGVWEQVFGPFSENEPRPNLAKDSDKPVARVQ